MLSSCNEHPINVNHKHCIPCSNLVGALRTKATKTMAAMNFIKQIITGKPVDAHNHQQFIRFGKGVFENRAYLKVKDGKKLQVWSGFEYGNDFIRIIIDTNPEIQITGKIYAKEQMTESYLNNEEKKKGFFVYTINEHFTQDKAKQFFEKCKNTYLLTKVKAPNADLKVNATPHNPRGKYKEKFCTLKAENETKEAIQNEITWNLKGKVIEIKHAFTITEIEIPKGLENNAAKARLEAKRVGTLKRTIDVDGQITTEEYPFKG